MYFYAARQPILDLNKNVYAYELLFRDSLNNVFPNIDGNEATSKMVEASQFNMGISEFTANKPAFINFTLDTISQGYPLMLSTDELVVEILETIKPGKKLLSCCQELHQKGYTLALDDYQHQKVWAHFYPFVSIIKINLLQTSFDAVTEIKKALVGFPHIKLLAEKVETHEQYQQAIDFGFELFQGYFFAKPEMVKSKSLSPSQVAMAELLYESSKTELDLKAITEVFQRDVSLSYKLLRYVNSSLFMRQSEISSIKQALVSLGIKELKRFIGLMFATNMNAEKPTELINISMARAKFCELITSQISKTSDISLSFLVGLLSKIDAILDENLETILKKLPLSDEIKKPLLTHKGTLAVVIKLVDFIEKAQWDKVDIAAEKLKLDKETVLKDYNEALAWADAQTNAVMS